MKRFLLLALPLLVLTMAVFHFAVAALGRAPDLSGARLAGPGPQSWAVAGAWLLESLALAALFLLVQGVAGGRLLNGLLTGWIAWVFRGPLLVISVVTLAGQPAAPWWSLTLGWLLLYSICGLLLGFLASASGLPPS
ncbi:MAG TPA: hypothetical protein VHQ90_06840 [Thermoanaerobaculia bacterium]|nr:hypothetical protein [Thermoanaerobaculia bacterium]